MTAVTAKPIDDGRHRKRRGYGIDGSRGRVRKTQAGVDNGGSAMGNIANGDDDDVAAGPH